MNLKTAFKILAVLFILAFSISSFIYFLLKPSYFSKEIKKQVEESQEKIMTKEEKRDLMLKNLITPKNSTSTEIKSSPRTNSDDTPEEIEKKEVILKNLANSSDQEEVNNIVETLPENEEVNKTEEVSQEKEEKRQIILKNLKN